VNKKGGAGNGPAFFVSVCEEPTNKKPFFIFELADAATDFEPGFAWTFRPSSNRLSGLSEQGLTKACKQLRFCIFQTAGKHAAAGISVAACLEACLPCDSAY